MDLKEIAAISGKSGLFRVLKPTRAGVILESLDEQRTRSVAGPQSRVSLLKEISIYTTDAEGSVPLEEVMRKIHAKYGDQPLPVDNKADADALGDFVGEVLPEYDRDRVYPSDMKKLVLWYTLLVNHLPEFFQTPAPAETDAEAAPADAETKAAKSGEEAKG
ncbi:MAG: DUF5606 domain-containing protein [Cytophagales bacterium]|nr:DUF5606 domain-containing protein [Cytophagales bacterium]